MAGLTTTLLATAAVVGAASSVASGYSAKQAARREAGALQEQGNLALEESRLAAQQRADEVRKTAKKQKLAFLKNGVTLEGSPLLTIQETERQGQQEVDAIIKRGYALNDLYATRASITENQGRAQFIGGIGSGLSNLASFGVSMYSPSTTKQPTDMNGGVGTLISTSSGMGYRHA